MQFITKAYRSLGHSTWPNLCRLCDRWGSGVVCLPCKAQYIQDVPRCQRCALPSAETVCKACLSAPPPWHRCAAVLPYAEPWRHLMADFKFHADTGLARMFGPLLKHEAVVSGLLSSTNWVLPVPLSQVRLRERGFNQSLLLAKALQHPHVLPQGLLRLRHTPAQMGLPRQERLLNLTHAFACNPKHIEDMRDRQVLLVDDVMTTGSTLRACTLALRQAGVKQVDVLVLARAALQDTPQSASTH